MQKGESSSVWVIARKDYYASYVMVFFLTTLVIYVVLRLLKPPLEFSPDYLLILLLVELVLLFARVARVRSLLSSGVSVPGTVKEVYRVGSGAGSQTRVEYTYVYEGEEHGASCPKRGDFEPGQSITVVLDPRAPGRSLIKDVFVAG